MIALLFRVVDDTGAIVVPAHLVDYEAAERDAEESAAIVEHHPRPCWLQVRDPDGDLWPANRWIVVDDRTFR